MGDNQAEGICTRSRALSANSERRGEDQIHQRSNINTSSKKSSGRRKKPSRGQTPEELSSPSNMQQVLETTPPVPVPQAFGT